MYRSPLLVLIAIVFASISFTACDSTEEEGLDVLDRVVGQGPAAKEGQCLTLLYTGWLENGHKFGSSIDENKSYGFHLNVGQEIEGWHKGIRGMRVGGVRRLIIPPGLAYGNTGKDPIPPNATVIYEIELLGIADLPEGATCKGSELPAVQIEDLDVGDGQTAAEGQCLSVHYTGWLENGTKFDSSVDRNRPFQFQLGANQVIMGWDKGVPGMRVGGKRKLTIPPHLGYGNKGILVGLPNNATLTFEIELLDILAPPQDAACNA